VNAARCDAARTQRRRQDDDAEIGDGDYRQAHRLGPFWRSGYHPGVVGQNCAHGGRFARGARIFASSTSARICCCADRAQRRLSLDQSSTCFPISRTASTGQGTKLSGGEQQMLAIARILRTGARFLMLDEPTEGLAPVIIQQIGHTIARLKSEGFTILLVEQNFRFPRRCGPLLHRRARQDHRRFSQTRSASQYGQASHLSRRLKPMQISNKEPNMGSRTLSSLLLAPC